MPVFRPGVVLYKDVGQLQDAGNSTTLAHYLDLLASVGMVQGLQKFAGEPVRLLDSGALIVGASDWGVSDFNPFVAMEHAVTRSEARGREPLSAQQAIPLGAVVDAYTINAAFALKQERTTGSLELGKRAMLDRDIFSVDPFDLHDTKVLFTYLDGRRQR